ncbi:MAG: alternative ribosome rescue aminoacyl-tRNA hydrolase ArfB [Gemmatimonadota bacterium]|nr:alternative ribosome rescue aminoacyl-tRNA hydrolase ArfB [Gemmatimonadota bacterium]
MDDPSALPITPALAIPRAELRYQASRSGGPGGQHVNTSSTRIELWWDIAESPALDEAQRARLLDRLASRLDTAGRLRLVSAAHRSQAQNREAVTKRLQTVIAAALKIPKVRRATRPTRASKERRLKAKKERAATKRDRRIRGDE